MVVGALKGLWYRQFAPANVNVTLYVTCLGNRTVCTGPGGLLNGFSIPLWFGRRNNLTGYRKKGKNAWLPCVWDGCLLRENLTGIYYIHIHVCIYINTHIRTYICTLYRHIYNYILNGYIHTYIHTQHGCSYIYIWIHMCIYIYTFVYTYKSVSIYTYIISIINYIYIYVCCTYHVSVNSCKPIQ